MLRTLTNTAFASICIIYNINTTVFQLTALNHKGMFSPYFFYVHCPLLWKKFWSIPCTTRIFSIAPFSSRTTPRGLNLCQTTNFRLFQTERICRWQFYIWWKWQRVLLKSRKPSGKRSNFLLRAISPFHTVFSTTCTKHT